ncbi:hexokinase-2-like [Argiope bruennichi]|uniref:Phosphotransferase n=1 Tax=Argiope bruennichi TaxID=94029 RepID=A0A8T0F299_ARGBR|nr:hexokinase-2-like [Argiope bruennichi]KAF8784592.1 Hexokinase-2 like protein [Argiope bruennichi]
MVVGNRRKIEALTRELVLTNDQLQKVSVNLLHEFHKGLSWDTHSNAAVKMFPTYVTDVPNGKEQGKFLALDLGGTNFRVLLITLEEEEFQMENEVFGIPESIMLGTGEQLFDHIAECLANFMERQNVKHLHLPLGFTFSFPCKQEGLASARLTNWTKGFKCSGVEGEDVGELLQAAVTRRGDIDVNVVAIINDTTGTLMSCAHKNRECRIGLIIGTGTNACFMDTVYVNEGSRPKTRPYMAKLDNDVDLWDSDAVEPRQVIVNTEWGAFGDDGCLDFIRTEYDREVDRVSLNPGKQLFEKMISGMYMGEVARQVLVKLTRDGLLFGGKFSTQLLTPYAFKTKYISMIESDSKNSFEETRNVMNLLGLEHATDFDLNNVKLVCARVSTRAAFLVSAAVATILNKIKRPHTTVGVDGSVYKCHPHFHDLMEKKIEELTIPDYKFDLMLSEDGSGRGAALVAAVAERSR